MAALQVLVLGPLDVRVGHQTVPPGGLRSRRVLASLVAHVGRSCPEAALILDVWGDQPPPSARNSVQSHVSRWRRALGADRIVRRDQGYELRPDTEVDALRIGSLTDHAREAARLGNWDRALASYEDALALWRGTAFEGFHDVASCRSWAVELEEQRVFTLEERADAKLALGMHAQATADLERLTVEHPWRERLWRQRALALYRCDRQAEAVRVLAEFRTRLVDETGLSASTSLHRLEQAILNQERHLESGPLALPDGGHRSPRNQPSIAALPPPEPPLQPLEHQLDDLGASAEILEWAALMGDEFELAVLEAATVGSPVGDAALDLLEVSETAGLVEELGPGLWRFRDPRVRDALRQRSGPTRSARRHAKIARAIDAVYGPDSQTQAARVARHLCEAAEPGSTDDAVTRATEVARQLLARTAAQDALIHASAGLTANGLNPDRPPEHDATLYTLAADAHYHLLDDAGRIEAADRAVAAARRSGSASLLARAAAARSAFWTQGGWDDGAVTLIRECLNGLGSAHQDLRAALLANLAGMVAVSGGADTDPPLDAAVGLAREAVALAPPGSPEFSSTRSSYIVTLWNGPHAAEQIAVANELERHGGPDSKILAARWRAAPRLMLGDRSGFEADVDLLVTESTRRSWNALLAYGLQCQALSALLDGRFDTAAALGDRAVEVAGNHPNFTRVVLAQAFWSAVERQELTSLEPLVRSSVDENPEMPIFRAMLALCEAHLGNLDEADKLLGETIGHRFESVPRDVLWLATLGGTAAVAASLASRRHAEIIGPLLDEYRGQLLVVAGGSFAYGAVDRFRAMMAATLGDRPGAEQRFRAAEQLEARIGSDLLVARTRWWREMLLGASARTSA